MYQNSMSSVGSARRHSTSAHTLTQTGPGAQPPPVRTRTGTSNTNNTANSSLNVAIRRFRRLFREYQNLERQLLNTYGSERAIPPANRERLRNLHRRVLNADATARSRRNH